LDELTKKPATKRDPSSNELYAFIDQYITDHEQQRAKGSLNVYRALKKHLEGYESATGGRVTFEQANKRFFQSFHNYLLTLTKKDKDGNTVKALNNITVAKQLSTLKTFLNYAREDDALKVEIPQFKYKIERDDKNLKVIALTQNEFYTLFYMDLSKRPAWDQVRDVFIFSCATGLRYSDLKQLRWEHIKGDTIELTSVKTNKATTVPLNPYAKAILKKYAKEPRPLNVISNQRSNEHLEKICEWAGFNEKIPISRKYGNKQIEKDFEKYKLIRMHCGRKTFVTLSLEKEMPAEVVMSLTGHTDYKSFKRYVNVAEERKKQAMSKAWGTKTINPKLKAVK
jgi:integrase